MTITVVEYEWTQGTTHDLLPISLSRPDGTSVDLTGITPANITLYRRQVIGTYTSPFVACTGSAQTITSVNPGAFTYKFSAADVATVGLYDIYFSIDFGQGGTPDLSKSFPQRLRIVATT